MLLYQCLQSLDAHSIDGLLDFINELKNAIDSEPVRKGVKAQKVSKHGMYNSMASLFYNLYDIYVYIFLLYSI